MNSSLRTLCLVAGLGGIVLLSGCKRDWLRGLLSDSPSASPTSRPEPKPAIPTPTPSPTPIYIPRKTMETARLFNGLQLRTTLESEAGSTATAERNTPGSYTVEVNVKVKVPRANQDIEALSKLNEALPQVLPGLAAMLPTAKVSAGYEDLYGRKLAYVERNMARLEQVLSRHNFFDCETILELLHPETRRAAVLVQSEMDIDTDGSDGDRVPNPEGKDLFFQPMTSYRWSKQTTTPNPFLAASEAKLRAVESELLQAKGQGGGTLQALRDKLGAARYEVNQLTKNSFLISAADPFIVLPGFMFNGKDPVFTPKLGDYCVVIYKDVIYPAIVGDAGPSFKAGEASMRLAKELNARSSAISRPVSDLKVTYLVFPNSADKPFSPPDLDRWRARVETLLQEIGGHGGRLHAWETIAKPAPTPTPPPTPTPSPTASPSPSPLSSPSPSASVSPLPAETPVPSPTAIPNVSPTPTPPVTASRAGEAAP